MFSNYNDKPGRNYIWISSCSAHQEYDSECEICQAGTWILKTEDFSDKVFIIEPLEPYVPDPNGKQAFELFLDRIYSKKPKQENDN